MSKKRTVLGLLAVAAVFACSDSAAPPVDLPASESGVMQSSSFRPLAWAPTGEPPQFSAANHAWDDEGGFDPDEQVFASPSAGAPLLTTYEASFWAVVGQASGVKIHRVVTSAYGWSLAAVAYPYLTFVIPPDGLDKGPTGEEYAYGDSVLITVTIDTTAMIVHMEPSGLTFDDDSPAVLTYWYTGAGGDFNGNGVVDKEDVYIEENLLDVWTTQYGWNWVPLGAEQSLSDDWLRADIEHFSGFAVAY